jgi:hypothetical protein
MTDLRYYWRSKSWKEDETVLDIDWCPASLHAGLYRCNNYSRGKQSSSGAKGKCYNPEQEFLADNQIGIFYSAIAVEIITFFAGYYMGLHAKAARGRVADRYAALTLIIL